MELQIQERKVQVIRTNVKPGAEVLRVAVCCRVGRIARFPYLTDALLSG